MSTSSGETEKPSHARATAAASSVGMNGSWMPVASVVPSQNGASAGWGRPMSSNTVSRVAQKLRRRSPPAQWAIPPSPSGRVSVA
ncbi:hypothetical protein I6I09_05025 [Corynebacterium bovis]|nr:hypothetical protein [Corynebacterium bovis]QQC48243.1 hypothetical protein I6I09_05025 [Corynebacterium bovis]